MARFRCLAERCEDTCCAGLSVPLDAESLERARAVLSPAEMEAAVEPRRDLPGNVAVLRHRPDGACTLLTPARRCGLQERHGERALSTACARFPRTVSQVRGVAELSGTPSCPEVARLLVTDEDALQVAPAEASAAQDATPWSERRAALRDEALGLLALPEPLSVRLALLGYLAADPRALAHRAAVARTVAALDVPGAQWLEVADALWGGRAALVERLRRLHAALEPLDWPRFVERRAALVRQHPWAEPAFDRLAQNAWLRGAGLEGSAQEAVTTFALRLGLLRIAWVRSPLPGDRAAGELLLSQLAQTLAKYVDASAELLALRDELTAAPPTELFGLLLTLAKLHP